MIFFYQSNTKQETRNWTCKVEKWQKRPGVQPVSGCWCQVELAACPAAGHLCRSMLSWLRARMGNCLNSHTADDVSLLRDGGGNSISTEQLETQPQYVLRGSSIQTESAAAQAQLYYPSPNVSRPASQLTEEEQVKIAQRIGLIQHLPTGTFDGCKKNRECVICMIEFNIGDAIRYLPCMHSYHIDCIDDWLMRSFTCPSCMEPVDAALLVAYDSN